jgi:hypothetical protein
MFGGDQLSDDYDPVGSRYSAQHDLGANGLCANTGCNCRGEHVRNFPCPTEDPHALRGYSRISFFRVGEYGEFAVVTHAPAFPDRVRISGKRFEVIDRWPEDRGSGGTRVKFQDGTIELFIWPEYGNPEAKRITAAEYCGAAEPSVSAQSEVRVVRDIRIGDEVITPASERDGTIEERGKVLDITAEPKYNVRVRTRSGTAWWHDYILKKVVYAESVCDGHCQQWINNAVECGKGCRRGVGRCSKCHGDVRPGKLCSVCAQRSLDEANREAARLEAEKAEATRIAKRDDELKKAKIIAEQRLAKAEFDNSDIARRFGLLEID